MNAENFADIIRNPSQLYQLPYQELKGLVLQYPYCRNLHHLLLQKCHLDQHRDFENVLEKTALYSIDRRYLYRQLRALRSEVEVDASYELGTDYLELHDLSSLGNRREPLPLEVGTQEPVAPGAGNGAPGQTPSPAMESPAVQTSRAEDSGDDFANLQEALRLVQASPGRPQPSPSGEPADSKTGFLADAELLAACAACLQVLEPPLTTVERPSLSSVTEPPRPQPKPKSSFSSWVRQYQPEHVQPHLDAFMESSRLETEKKKKKKKDRIIAFAERSLHMNEEVVSETLAELLVQQERYDRAIQMYERLCLIFPEKSGYFASKIEQLKKYN